MVSATKAVSFYLFLFLFLFLCFPSKASSEPTEPDPVPTPWPLQFHSVLFMNRSGTLQMVDLWYDWPNGRNFNIIQTQLGSLLYDLEWTNGTSFFYTLDSDQTCRVVDLEVGILRPNWLDGATYLGRRYMDGFLCNAWQKLDFIWYYEDVATKRPVFWVFYSGYSAHVMTFEVGKVLEDPKWQAPVYCFNEEKKSVVESASDGGWDGGLMRMVVSGGNVGVN
ncbi:uncharacterized protein At4g14100-like [Diospyros lotus]|uniref:uncharacterized protein At4g14100-like n=1 Tax=Diospyros lotus TaxID=55363 RepID=UPI0022591838|nr:uncharacterized protein At4g14100-like [Diospyros lotus]